MQYGKLQIDSFKLAGTYNDLFYAFINDLVDFDITPSKYKNVVLKRIKKEWYLKAFFNV